MVLNMFFLISVHSVPWGSCCCLFKSNQISMVGVDLQVRVKHVTL